MELIGLRVDPKGGLQWFPNLNQLKSTAPDFEVQNSISVICVSCRWWLVWDCDSATRTDKTTWSSWFPEHSTQMLEQLVTCMLHPNFAPLFSKICPVFVVNSLEINSTVISETSPGTCSANAFGADLQPMEGPCIVGGIASMMTKKVFTTIVVAGLSILISLTWFHIPYSVGWC